MFLFKKRAGISTIKSAPPHLVPISISGLFCKLAGGHFFAFQRGIRAHYLAPFLDGKESLLTAPSQLWLRSHNWLFSEKFNRLMQAVFRFFFPGYAAFERLLSLTKYN